MGQSRIRLQHHTAPKDRRADELQSFKLADSSVCVVCRIRRPKNGFSSGRKSFMAAKRAALATSHPFLQLYPTQETYVLYESYRLNGVE